MTTSKETMAYLTWTPEGARSDNNSAYNQKQADLETMWTRMTEALKQCKEGALKESQSNSKIPASGETGAYVFTATFLNKLGPLLDKRNQAITANNRTLQHETQKKIDALLDQFSKDVHARVGMIAPNTKDNDHGRSEASKELYNELALTLGIPQPLRTDYEYQTDSWVMRAMDPNHLSQKAMGTIRHVAGMALPLYQRTTGTKAENASRINNATQLQAHLNNERNREMDPSYQVKLNEKELKALPTEIDDFAERQQKKEIKENDTSDKANERRWKRSVAKELKEMIAALTNNPTNLTLEKLEEYKVRLNAIESDERWHASKTKSKSELPELTKQMFRLVITRQQELMAAPRVAQQRFEDVPPIPGTKPNDTIPQVSNSNVSASSSRVSDYSGEMGSSSHTRDSSERRTFASKHRNDDEQDKPEGEFNVGKPANEDTLESRIISYIDRNKPGNIKFFSSDERTKAKRAWAQGANGPVAVLSEFMKMNQPNKRLAVDAGSWIAMKLALVRLESEMKEGDYPRIENLSSILSDAMAVCQTRLLDITASYAEKLTVTKATFIEHHKVFINAIQTTLESYNNIPEITNAVQSYVKAFDALQGITVAESIDLDLMNQYKRDYRWHQYCCHMLQAYDSLRTTLANPEENNNPAYQAFVQTITDHMADTATLTNMPVLTEHPDPHQGFIDRAELLFTGLKSIVIPEIMSHLTTLIVLFEQSIQTLKQTSKLESDAWRQQAEETEQSLNRLYNIAALHGVHGQSICHAVQQAGGKLKAPSPAVSQKFLFVLILRQLRQDIEKQMADFSIDQKSQHHQYAALAQAWFSFSKAVLDVPQDTSTSDFSDKVEDAFQAFAELHDGCAYLKEPGNVENPAAQLMPLQLKMETAIKYALEGLPKPVAQELHEYLNREPNTRPK